MLHALKLVCFFFFGVAEIKVTEFSSEEGLTLVYSWFIL
jgi:hypothetical protein